MLHKLVRSRSGNVAIMTALCLVPLCLAAGFGVDYARQSSAQRHLQEMADATSLALAASKERDQGRLETLANQFLTANQNMSRVGNLRLVEVMATEDDIDVIVEGNIPTTFMGLAGYQRLDVLASSLAERAVNGQVEVALILDNTRSMEDAVGGVKRITTLKTAANRLVDELMREEDGAVRIGLIPYGEYVNVGTSNRGAAWLSVAPDRSETKIEGARKYECKNVATAWRDVRWVPPRDCSYSRDGTWVPRTCEGHWEREATAWEEQCTEANPGKEVTRHYSWHGCVVSRIDPNPQHGNNRLHVGNPAQRYVGLVEESQRCLTEIVPLTATKPALSSAIDGMVTSRPGHSEPWTYIPAGMVWGWNVLAPAEPFTQAAAYDPQNAAPRKVAVLMTDGANSMRFRPSDGRHERISLGQDNENNADVIKTNSDTLAICSNMKQEGIEIFTVAFMVDSPSAKAMLEACSTDPTTHYFDASSSEDLLAAFEGIGNSLRVVRLAR